MDARAARLAKVAEAAARVAVTARVVKMVGN